MSDTSIAQIIRYGTAAARVAFTPDPAVGSQVLYLWYETDNAPDTYAWDGSAWVQINTAAAGGINQLTGDGTAGPGSGSQALTLANTAVTPGSYTNTNLTVDSKGRIIAASNGSSSVVVQIVNTQTGAVATGTTIIPVDDTIPQNTEGTEFMTLAITPTSATNHLRIDVLFYAATNSTTDWISAALFQDSTAAALAAGYAFQDATGGSIPVMIRYVMVAGTTSATTFKVRGGPRDAATTMTFNGFTSGRIFGGVLASSITITEYIP